MARRPILRRYLVVGVGLACLLALALSTANAGGGNVMPPTAKPRGYSLTRMASLMAEFSTSTNKMTYFPKTPFQIVYADPVTWTNTFHVKTGTMLFVPVMWQDNTSPVVGDFPADASGVNDYFFGRDQLGAHDMDIVVDGNVTTLGRGYVAGPVSATLHDGHDGIPPGDQFIQVGAFLTPLKKGEHTITIRATLDGDAIGDVPWAFSIDYTVIVE